MIAFLTIEEDSPLGVFAAIDGDDCKVIPLNEFFAESLLDMSEVQRERFAVEFENFVKTLIDNGD